jgi:hypothetical protein
MPGRRTSRGDGPDRPGGATSDARSTGEVVASLIVNAQALIAKEIELLGHELKSLVGRRIAAVAILLVGALAAAGVLLLAAVTTAIALENVFDERWMAWGAVTLGSLLVAIVLFLIAATLLSGSWSPRSRRKDPTSTTEWLRGLGEELSAGITDPSSHDVADGADQERGR